MEFLEIVIMTGVLIFAMMVIQNKKPREQREKQQTELEDNTEIISSNDISNSTPNIQPSNIETVYEEGGSCFDKAKPTTAASKKTNTSKSHSNRPKMEQNRADESEFDLKKAVVYSEILRPKFKDDEI